MQQQRQARDSQSNGSPAQERPSDANVRCRDDELIETFVEPHPHRRGRAEMRVREGGVPIWALIGYLEAVEGDLDRAARDYEISRDAVEAAVAYYRRNRDVIDARIEANVMSAASY